MSLAPPDAALRASVVVPARDEEERIAACLRALAGQRGVAPEEYEVVLVLDACQDRTAARALAVAGAHPGLRLLTVEGPGRGAGAARRVGMDLAAARLLALGRPGGLVASTDADSVVAPDWLRAQLDALAGGARAIGGRVELEPREAADLPPAVLRDRAVRAEARHREVLAGAGRGRAEHWQFSGASMAVTAEAYRAVGGLEPLSALEDEAFARALTRAGVPIERLAAVCVSTSSRRTGRAARGLSRDLALDEWLATRSFPRGRFAVPDLLAAKDGTVSVVLPTREVGGTVGGVLEALGPHVDSGLVDEVIVVDAGSADETRAVAAAWGARVHLESEILPECGPGCGKGDAMWRGLAAARGGLVVYLDADTADPEPGFVPGLLGPLLLGDPEIQLVKGTFRRPFRLGDAVAPDGGGRVTELTARPLLNLFAPELAGLGQPLSGEIAARRELLEAIPFPVGYGIEIAMVLDTLRVAGIGAIAQVDLGTRQNRHQPLRDLSPMAYAVLVAALRRSVGEAVIGAAAPGPIALPGPTGMEVRTLDFEERPPLARVDHGVKTTLNVPSSFFWNDS